MSRQTDITALAYDKRGKLLAVGKNSYTKTHPLQKKFAQHTDNANREYLHAELDAIIRARGKSIWKLVVIRYNRQGSPANAKPCQGCQKAIKRCNIQVVQHT